MAKPSKKQKKISFTELDPRVRYVAFPLMAIVALGAILFIVITLANLPKPEGAMRGVGADGFRAFEEKDGNLGVGSIVAKSKVVEALGAKAKEVKDPSVSTVFNLNGTRGQTVTYDIVKANGKPGSVYVDLMIFKNTFALEEANIYKNTGKTDSIRGHDTYYMHAQTIGSDREYTLLIVDGVKVYKFVLTQPFRDITISEVMAFASLKKIAENSTI